MKNLNTLMVATLLAFSAIILRADPEQDLIVVLKSEVGPVEKAEACRKLRLVGTSKSVPVVAELLRDERLSQAARYALEGMQTPKAGEAMRAALEAASGQIKVGLLDSLGWRAERASVPPITALLSDGDPAIAKAAATALGRIGGGEARDALAGTLPTIAPAIRPFVVEGLLGCAARALAENDAGAAERIYSSLFVPTEDEQTRLSAYGGLIRCAKDGGFGRIKTALEGSDGPAQMAALFEMRKAEGEGRWEGSGKNELLKLIVGLLPKAKPTLQVALLSIVRQSGGHSEASSVLTLTRSPEVAVQVAAVTALGEIGDANAVSALAEAAASRNPAVQAAARKSLVELYRGNVAAELIAQLGEAPAPMQLELVRALSARSEKASAPELLRVSRSGAPAARKAALAALGNLADGSHVAALVNLLAEAKDNDAREGVRVIFEKLAEREGVTPKWSLEPLVHGLAAGDPELRKSLLPIAMLYVDDGLSASIRSSLKDDDERVRGAAQRALCDARDVRLLPDMLVLARETSDVSLRSLSLEGVVRLVVSANMPIQRRAEALETAMALSSRAEDKRMVLSGVGQVPHSSTMALAEKATTDSSVKLEAELACLQIAQKLSGNDYAVAEASLTRLANVGSPSVQTNAKALLRKLNSGWLCAGPYRQAGKQAQDLFSVPFPPEQPGAEAVQWKRAPGSADGARPGEVDLAGVAAGDHCVIYLKTRVYVPTQQPVRFSIGSDDGIKLWVNGELVHSNNAVRGLTPGEDNAKGRLNQGWNDLQAKVTQHTLGSGMTLNITADDGKKVPGLTLDARGGI